MQKQSVGFFYIEISNILKNKKKQFNDNRLVQSIPEIVGELFAHKNDREAEIIICYLGDELLNENPAVRAEISALLSQIIENLTSEAHQNIMLRLSHKLTEWIKIETLMSVAYKKIIIQLQALSLKLILNQRFEECEHIIEVFNLIYIEKLKKNKWIHDLAGKVLRGIATDEVLNPLLKEFQTHKNHETWLVTRRLIRLGAVSTEPLLKLLKKSDDKDERLRILQVISNIGPGAVPVLIAQLREEGPWYYIRNLVMLLGRVGDQSHVPILQPFLKYGDLRVQREALNSIYQLAGKESEEIILSVLPFADNRLKLDIVNILGDIGNHRGVPFLLLELLESVLTITSKLGYELAERICAALGKIGSLEAVPIITEIIEQSPDSHILNPKIEESFHKVQTSAASALAMIKEKNEKVDSMSSKKSKHLLETIKKRDRTVDLEHINIWSSLYNNLTPDEADALYDALKEGICGEDCIIYKQGRPNSRLYFIEKGNLVLAYDQEGEEIWIKTIKPGNIVGAETFFVNSVCTTSMITISDVKIKFLEKDDLDKLNESFQEIESKLKDFCLKSESILDVLDQYGMERRSDERIDISGKISAQVLNDSGDAEGKTFKGDLLDISSGGLSFLINVSGKSPQYLLNQKLNVKFLLIGDNSRQEIDKDGIVVAVQDKVADNFSIHMKFDSILAQFPLIRAGKFKIGLSNTGLVVKKDEFLITRW